MVSNHINLLKFIGPCPHLGGVGKRKVLLHLGCILGHDIKFSCLHYGYEVGFLIIFMHNWYDLVRVRAFLSILDKEEGGSGFGKGIAGDMKFLLEGANGCLLLQVAQDKCYCVFSCWRASKGFFVLVM